MAEKDEFVDSVRDFIKLWDRMIRKAKQEEWKVHPEAGIHTIDSDQVKTPLISYKLIERTRGDRSAIKPHYKETKQNINQSDETITTYSQKFKSTIQFGICGSTYEEADKTREEFEKFMIDYTGHFRKEGILELFLKRQLEDDTLEVNGQPLVKLPLRYFLRTERERDVTKSKIKNIDDNIEVPNSYKKFQTIVNQN